MLIAEASAVLRSMLYFSNLEDSGLIEESDYMYFLMLSDRADNL